MKNRSITLVGIIILVLQIVIFKDYISPFFWGELKVSGLACTCPDETVVNGQIYLKFITPDSLVKYQLDYSEIYVTERPSTNIDPMGADNYLIKGEVIGKKRISKNDPWNPVFQVDSWREVDIIKDLGVKALFLIQVIVFIAILYSSITAKSEE